MFREMQQIITLPLLTVPINTFELIHVLLEHYHHSQYQSMDFLTITTPYHENAYNVRTIPLLTVSMTAGHSSNQITGSMTNTFFHVSCHQTRAMQCSRNVLRANSRKALLSEAHQSSSWLPEIRTFVFPCNSSFLEEFGLVKTRMNWKTSQVIL